jgi:mediator of RNA polymerase II transcription subunit 11
MAKPNEQLSRLQQLETLEQHLAKALESAGFLLTELSKDKPLTKQVENHTQIFVKSMEQLETGFQQQITYLTTVATAQPHEGSSYAAHKDLQMSYHRQEHIKSRLNDLDRMRFDYQPANIDAKQELST